MFVALDTPNADRLGEARSSAERAETVVVIDHHPDGVEFGDVHVIEPQRRRPASSSGICVEALDNAPRRVALCCYVGLLTDTGRFSYDNTTRDALRARRRDARRRRRPAEVARFVYQSRSRGVARAREHARCRGSRSPTAAASPTRGSTTTTSPRSALCPKRPSTCPTPFALLGGIDVATAAAPARRRGAR